MKRDTRDSQGIASIPARGSTIVYRVMLPTADGTPRAEPNRFAHLTARVPPAPRPDILPDDDGYVEPGSGGMSVDFHWHAIYPALLDRVLDPRSPERVWYIDIEAFGEGLTCRRESRGARDHGYVEPSTRMRVEEYQRLLADTAIHWRVYLAVQENDP